MAIRYVGRFVTITCICGKQKLGLANGQEYPSSTIYCRVKAAK